MQNVSDKLDLLFESSGKDMRYRTRELIESMVNYLDLVEGDPDLEEDDDREPVGDEEPSLGSFDRLTNQEKSYLQRGWFFLQGSDLEDDDCDDEDDDPAELSEESGIADQEGLLEQIGLRDWTGTVMG